MPKCLPALHAVRRRLIQRKRDTPKDGGCTVSKLKLALFALDTYARMAIDKAGADCVGGDLRRARVSARTALLGAALDGLLSRPGPNR